jgi:hypothetical protein
MYMLTEVKRELDKSRQTYSNHCASKRTEDEWSSLDKFSFLIAGSCGWHMTNATAERQRKSNRTVTFQPPWFSALGAIADSQNEGRGKARAR